MVMDQKTWELRVDQHLNSIPGSSPNNHMTLDMPLVLYMLTFVFCEIDLSPFLLFSLLFVCFFFSSPFWWQAVKAPGYKAVIVPQN